MANKPLGRSVTPDVAERALEMIQEAKDKDLEVTMAKQM